MTFDRLIATIITIGGIIWTYWFFLMKKDDMVQVTDSDKITILIDGGYSPSTISIPKGTTTTLSFLRKDKSSCLEEVVIPDFKIRKYIPLNTPTEIKITPNATGTFELSCGMNMFHATIIVR